VDYRFNQAGGGADKQLVADGGPGAIDAAQRVEERRHRARQARAKHRAKWELLAKQQEEFKAWQQAHLAEWLYKGPGIGV
jgi:hypothetical protein